MKKFILMIVILATNSAFADATYPKLFFSYSPLYDSICSQNPNTKADSAWAMEARDRTQEFQTLWDTEGSVFMTKLTELFGYGFSRTEMTATLSVCDNSSSYSSPLVISVARFLKSYQGQNPVPEDYKFIELVFHELIHTFVGEHINFPTTLIQKYANEDRLTRNHLHLMAIQKYVYSEMKRQDILDFLEQRYTTGNASEAYKRAWAIVKAEGYEAFVQELRK